MGKIRAVRAVVVVAVVATLLAGTGSATAGLPSEPEHRPLIFVHGFAGSGNQFESQAMRFASNGYPVEHIYVHEYDSLFASATQDQVRARLDTLIADVQADTGASQVDLLAHSLGTGLMQNYLNSDPERSADVAHYVNLDGSTGAAPPGGVPTLAVWGAGSPTREITGATNVYFPSQTHTQVVTSSETFVEIYEFFNGEPPVSPDIVRQDEGEITLRGRALEFISNEGVDGATLEIHELDGATGHRLDATPEATFTLTGDGSWGPFSPDPTAHYELVIRKEASAHHHYFEPFVRTNHLMRLLTSEPGAGVDALWEKSEDHANIVILRNKEWWGDQAAANDELTIGGTQVINAAVAPVSKRAIALFAYDAGVDQVSDVSVPVPGLSGLPFLTAVDLFLAADTPPTGTIAITENPRLGSGPVTVNVPNWAGIADRVTVQFNDYHLTRPIPPSAPVDLTATGGPRQVALDWEASADDGGAPLLSYAVLDDAEELVASTAPGVTAATIIGLPPGPSGTYRVVAVNQEGASPPATTAAVTVLEATTPFSDVAPAHLFHPEITWAAEAGVTSGFDDGTFRPTEPVSRQALAALLHRLVGAPVGPFPDPGFSDVPSGNLFEDEIAWARDAGVIEGYDDGTFRPTAPVSRQALAATLSRLPGAPIVPAGGLPFSDVPATHAFYAEISWAWNTKIVEGFDDGTFRPTARVSRQAIAAMLYRTTLAVALES